MNDDAARVPALVLCGGTTGARDAAIAQLAEPVAGGGALAVLRAGTGMFGSNAASPAPHVVIKRTPIGCVCCTAGVMFRVALAELLRASRPARLIVDLGQGVHVATLEAQLHGGSLARAVQVIGRIDLDSGSSSHAVRWSVSTETAQTAIPRQPSS